MQITIEIEDPPKGYSTPERRPIYLPFGETIILIGGCWIRAVDELTLGGETHICCHKLPPDSVT